MRMEYKLVTWPESQQYMDEPWFKEETLLVNKELNDTTYSGAYMIPVHRLGKPTQHTYLGFTKQQFVDFVFDGNQYGYFDVPKLTKCDSAYHNIDSSIRIPYGKAYLHRCPDCNAVSIYFNNYLTEMPSL